MKTIETKYRKINHDFLLEENRLTEKKQKYESIALSNQMPVEWHKAKDFNIFDSSFFGVLIIASQFSE